MSRASVFVLACAFITLTFAEDKHWRYSGDDGIDKWPEEFPKCAGKRQSPIDVNPFFSKYKEFEPFYFIHYHELPSEVIIKNNGHTVEVKMTTINKPEIGGSNLGAKYDFAQYHFHWGGDDLRGSEHTINHVRYPLELHLVHFKSDYANLTAALEKSDGAAVLSVLFVQSDYDNPALAPLVANMKAHKQVGVQKLTTDMYPLTSLLPKDLTRFYRYQGSLTTPPCAEIVSWTIFDEPVPISEKQLNAIRSVEDDHKAHLINNFRPTQPLNGRFVYRSFEK